MVGSMEGYGCDVLVRVDHVGDVLEFEEYIGFDSWRKRM
jgi:hypothetical protein